MTWELDRTNFRVICQRCGKVDAIVLDELYDGIMCTNGVFCESCMCDKCFGAEHREFHQGEYFWDYWLCDDCKDK